MQWQILPGRSCAGHDFDLSGQLEPAYHVAGDAFDWCVAPDAVTVSVHEGLGSGTPAAQATTLAITALRNARRTDMPLAPQASMADEAIYGIYGGRHHIESLLLRFDRRGDRSSVIDAGSPLLLRQRGNDLQEARFKRTPAGCELDDVGVPVGNLLASLGNRVITGGAAMANPPCCLS